MNVAVLFVPSRKTLILVGLTQVEGLGDHVSRGQLSVELLHKLNDNVKFSVEFIVAVEPIAKDITFSIQVKLLPFKDYLVVFISNVKFGYVAVLKVFDTPDNTVEIV